MLTNPQKALIKQAQRDLGLPDEEYRDTLRTFFGVDSCTAPELEDRHLDKLLAFWEAIYWREVDRRSADFQSAVSQASSLPIRVPSKIFQRRHYWSSKNTAVETSRDRFVHDSIHTEIAGLEAQMRALGYHPNYYTALRRRIPNDHHYAAALRKTLRSKQSKLQPA